MLVPGYVLLSLELRVQPAVLTLAAGTGNDSLLTARLKIIRPAPDCTAGVVAGSFPNDHAVLQEQDLMGDFVHQVIVRGQ